MTNHCTYATIYIVMSAESFSHNMPFQLEKREPSESGYRLLTGHHRTDGSFKTTEQLHTEYIRLTDNLVHLMTDGVEAVDATTGEHSIEQVDAVIWLDKSARPLAWLTKDLWPLLATDADGKVPEMPEFKFVNIDRNQWTSSINPEGQGMSNVSKIDESIIRSLRSVFLSNPSDRRDGLVESIDDAPTQFDGKTVLIVDEVLSTGRTLDYATKFFSRAFPEAKIASTHWMGGLVGKGRAVGNADIPVWYNSKSPYGRGVGERNVPVSLASANTTQRMGAWFLSAALRTPDPLSKELRSEMKHLAEDAKEGKVFIEPSRKREDDDFEERALRLNHYETLQEYVVHRRELMTNRDKK